MTVGGWVPSEGFRVPPKSCLGLNAPSVLFPISSSHVHPELCPERKWEMPGKGKIAEGDGLCILTVDAVEDVSWPGTKT